MSSAHPPLVLVHDRGGAAGDWDALSWPDGVEVVAVELPEAAEPGDDGMTDARAATVARLEALGRPAVLIGHGTGARITTTVHAEHPELVAAEVVVEPDYGDASLLARRSRPVLGVYSSEERAAIERNAGTADLAVWPGFGPGPHLAAPAAFVRTVTRWLARALPAG